tara:strand:+ start:187 stop:654 length:468 start_codon:yes stop_codon:yes gene_type:complete
LESIKSQEKSNNQKHNDALARIGKLIKEARIEGNQTLNELASNVKISAHQLKAIEDGRIDLLPEKIFVRAMIKKISEKIEIDSQLILKEFETYDEETKIKEYVEEVSKVSNKSPLFLLLTIFFSGMVGLITSSLLLSMFSYINSQSDQEIIIEKN